MRATVCDVAARAGVSAMAVSAVLNGVRSSRVRVSKEKAERIRQAALELHYQPNRMGQILRGARTNQIALVFQNFENLPHESLYRSEVMNGVVAALSPHDYTMTLCPQLAGDGIPRTFFEGLFDGVLWCRPELSETMKLTLQNASSPVVMLHAPPEALPGAPSFCVDEEGAFQLLLDHLASLGHTSVAVLSDRKGARTARDRARVSSLKATARRRGMREPEFLILDDNLRVLATYVGIEAPHTALVCFGSKLASEVLQALENLGIDVPGQISVVAFGTSPTSVTTHPSLTSIAQPVELMAREAAAHLLDRIQHVEAGGSQMPSVSHLYEGLLVLGESSGAVRPR